MTARPVDWLWYPYIAKGKITMLGGMPGCGKSWFGMWIAACVTRGATPAGSHLWPNGEPVSSPANVILLAAEDDNEDVIKPRMELLGADMSRVFVHKRPFLLDDLGRTRLREAVGDIHPALLTTDPVQAYLDPGKDMHRANQVRNFIQGLQDLACEFRYAHMLTGHYSKARKGSAVDRFIGSIDFIAACRSALATKLISPPDAATARVLLSHVKNNIARHAGPTLEWQLAGEDGPQDHPPQCPFTIGLAGDGLDVDMMLEDEKDAEEGRRGSVGLAEATAWLVDHMRECGGETPAKEVKSAAKECDISARTLDRAKRAAGVLVYRDSAEGGARGAGKWMWKVREV